MNYSDLHEAAKSIYFYEIVKYWKKTKIIKNEIPELEILSYYNQNPIHHPEADDVLGHVLECLKFCKTDSPIVKLSVLFHDIGKGITASNYDAISHPYYNFYKHDTAGVYVMENVAKRLNFPQDVTETICYCIRHHMNAHKFIEMKPFKVRNIRLNKDYEVLKKVTFCDDASRGYKFDIKKYQKNLNFADWIITQPENIKKSSIDYSIFE